MIIFRWNITKYQKLIKDRQISFQSIVSAIEQGSILADMSHPNKARYPHQRIFKVVIDNYV